MSKHAGLSGQTHHTHRDQLLGVVRALPKSFKTTPPIEICVRRIGFVVLATRNVGHSIAGLISMWSTIISRLINRVAVVRVCVCVKQSAYVGVRLCVCVCVCKIRYSIAFAPSPPPQLRFANSSVHASFRISSSATAESASHSKPHTHSLTRTLDYHTRK